MDHRERAARWLPWALFAFALLVRVLIAWLVRQPGYTDAYYYAVGARQLFAGQGFSEPFIWNYLNPPAGLPHPGFQYWMPLTSILAWLGMLGLGESYKAMQAPFVLLSALLPLVAYGITWDLTKEIKYALLAGLLAIFPGFYALFFVVTDNFAPFALAGSLCLWTAGRGLRDRRPLWFGLAGLAAGFAHLARADGLLLALVALAAAAGTWLGAGTDRAARTRTLAASLAWVLGGYVLVMAPWFLRTWQVSGSPLAGGGVKTLFLTDYDDIFAYGRPLNLETYLAWGWPAILGSKWDALILNLQRLWIEGLLIVLVPFTALGLWRWRHDRVLWPFFLYAPLLFLSMTYAFTFPGMRGGLFHSNGALLPFFFAAAGPGLEVMLRWVARRRRGWNVRQAWPVFAGGLVVLASIVTLSALWQTGPLSGEWNRRDQAYARIGKVLEKHGDANEIVMVGGAPGFTWHTGQAAISIPNEPLDVILEVAERYGAQYLVLDSARPRTTDDLYEGKVEHPGFRLRLALGDQDKAWQLYELRPEDRP